MKIKALIFWIIKISSIIFTLDENISLMCFLIKGNIWEKELKLKYFVSGENASNIFFTVFDLVGPNADLYQKIDPKQDNKISNSQKLTMPINSTHNYRLCWDSKDGSEKQINFEYDNKIKRNTISKKDIKTHTNSLTKFKKTVLDIKDSVENHYIIESEYKNTIGKLNSKLKNSFFIKSIVFTILILVQVIIFMRIINNKFNDVKQIVIGN